MARNGFLSFFLLACAACSSTSTIDGLWADLEADAQRSERLAEPDPARTQLVAERAAKARTLAEEGRLHSARDYLRASVLIVESDSPANWEMAAVLGRTAAEMGEPMGLRVVAEAIDKDLMRQGLPQRYGTQWIWDSEKLAWRLYPIDATTTDEERAALGVPSYGELIRDEINLGAPSHAPH